MDFERIECLANNKILSLYDDIIEENSIISVCLCDMNAGFNCRNNRLCFFTTSSTTQSNCVYSCYVIGGIESTFMQPSGVYAFNYIDTNNADFFSGYCQKYCHR